MDLSFYPPQDDTRDLRFRPAPVNQAKTLTPEQAEQFNRNGFVSPLPAFDAEEAARMRSYFDELVDAVVSAPDQRNSYSIVQYHLVCEGLYDIVQDARLLDYVEDIIGPDIVCWGTQLFCKLPGDTKSVPLHQDATYWALTPAKTVTVWLAIDDVDPENGAMEFVPGSHLSGPLAHSDHELDGTRVLRRQVVGADSYQSRYSNDLRAGEVSLHSDLLLHGSSPNASSRRRAGLTLRYAAGEVQATPGYDWFYAGSVHCRGDVPSWWPDRKRPVGEHPEVMAEFVGEFDGQDLNDLAAAKASGMA
ncbi:MAG: phytanoyl-CoA dioxygenase family protein [Actinobacteria bacterium]|nr:phytanoyl-CoA dioxygenase family protein [Actinomycetota bacterium]